MAIYTSQYGLPQQTISYLNQPLPDISGIFSLPQSQAVVPVEEITESLAPTGLTPEQLSLLYPQYNLDRGGDGPRGGGDFGNLDLSTAKQFNINGNIVTGYKNLNTGLYQDISGKNLQNLGLRNIPGITGLLDNIFGSKEPTYPGLFDTVSTRALFKNPYLAKSFFDRQDVAKQQKIQDEIDAYNLEKAREVQTMQQAAANKSSGTGGYQSSWGGGGGAGGDGGGFMGGSGTAADMGSF